MHQEHFFVQLPRLQTMLCTDILIPVSGAGLMAALQCVLDSVHRRQYPFRRPLRMCAREGTIHGQRQVQRVLPSLLTHRFASINDLSIQEGEREFFWPLGRSPGEHPRLSALGL